MPRDELLIHIAINFIIGMANGAIEEGVDFDVFEQTLHRKDLPAHILETLRKYEQRTS